MPRDVGDRKCPNRDVPIETQATEGPMPFLLFPLGFPFVSLRLSFDIFGAVPGLSFGLPLGFLSASKWLPGCMMGGGVPCLTQTYAYRVLHSFEQLCLPIVVITSSGLY